MATTKTIQPTGTTITIPAMTDRPDASVFSTDIDRITDAANALNSNLMSKLTNNINILKKETTTSSGDITFTYSGNRYDALLMVEDNSFVKSGIYTVIFKGAQPPDVKRLAGNSTLPTVDANGSITVNLTAWSKCILITTSLTEFS